MSIPESFWTDDAPIGEVPPMNEHAAMDRVIARVQRDILDDRESVINAARDLYALSMAGVDLGSDVWLDVQGRLFDAVQRVSPVLAPSPLVANRTAETSRLNMTGLARGIFTSPKPVGGA